MTVRPPAGLPVTSPSALATGIGSYLVWGFFPLFFVLLRGAGPVEVAAQRILWGGVCLVVVVTATRAWGAVGRTVADRRSRRVLVAAALCIGTVWFVYGYGALTGQAVDVALGYFMCPLVTLVLAVVVNGERLSRAQLTSAAILLLAVVVVTAGYGTFPWIAVVIAVTFAGYSLAKSRLDRSVTATVGLAVETFFMVPVALAVVAVLAASGEAAFLADGIDATDGWLVLSGPVTVVPLLLFAWAAQRLPLSVLGSVQYMNPALQLVSGAFILGEEMPAARWAGFALVWVAILVLVIGAALARRPRRP